MSRPVRIGYLVQQFLPEVGAGPARVGEMAVRWRAAGADVTILTGMPNRPVGRIHPDYRGRLVADEEWEGCRVLRSWLYASPKHGFARTVLNNLSFMVTSGVHGLARSPDVDVLIASSPPFFPHITGRLLAGIWRVPLVLEIRDLWPDYLAGMGVLKGAPLRALFATERALLRRADAVVVVTDMFRRRVIEKGVAPERVTVIPNGVDPAQYYRAEEPPPLPSLVRRGGEFIVGYLGNIGAGQGLSAVVDAAAILAREMPDARLVLAGDGPERARVEARAQELGLPNVSIHPPIPKSDTRAFYNACDAVLVPLAPVAIFQETVPSKLFEIMACERPVIAALGGEGARIVDESGCGVHVPPGDAAAIADAVRRMRALPAAERAAFGSAGRAYAERHYGREALSDRYLSLLTRLAARSPVPGDSSAADPASSPDVPVSPR